MLVFRLELNNIRRFEKEEIFFPLTGVIGLRGVNGTGKSTIFNTIDWVLWGKYHGVKKQSLLKQHKTPKNAATYGVVDFALNGDFYRVRRDLANSLTKNYVEKNKMRVAEGTTNVNSYIQNLFKMDQEAFRVCYYASQGDFDSLTQMNDSPRAAMISKLLRIDTIDEAAKGARDDKKALEIEIAEAKRNLKDDEELQASLKAETETEKHLKKQMKEIEKELKKLEKNLEELAVSKKESDKVYETYQSFSSQISNLETKRNTLLEHSLKNAEKQLQMLIEKRNRLSEIGNKKDYYFQLIQKKDELNDAKEQFVAVHRIEKQKSDIQANLEYYQKIATTAAEKLKSFDQIEEIIIKKEQEIAELDEHLALSREKGKELQTMLSIHKKSYQTIMLDKQQFEELGADVPCPTCNRPLGEHLGNQLNHLEEKRQEIIREVALSKKQLEKVVEIGLKDKDRLNKMKEELQKFQIKFREKSGFTSQLNNANQELTRQNHSLNELIGQRNQYPEKVDFDANGYKALIDEINSLVPIYEEIIQLHNQVESIPSIEESIEEMKKQISDINEQVIHISNQREQLHFDKEKHVLLSKEIDDLRTAIDTTKDNRYGIQSQIQRTNTLIETIKNDIKFNEERKIALKDKLQEIVELAKLDELYKAYKVSILAELAPILSDKMSDMIDVVTDGLYDRVKLDEKYNIFIYSQGEEHPLEIYSGGEQKLAALLQRIAVSQLLVEQTSQASFDMIALDEVTSSFDETRQDSMMEMLRGLNSVFKQILIVSHNEHVKDSFDHTLLIERGNDKKSSATWALTETGNPTFNIEEVKAIVKENFETEVIAEDELVEA